MEKEVAAFCHDSIVLYLELDLMQQMNKNQL